MKTKVLSVLLGISILVIFVLIIYAIKVKPECERAHVDDINRSYYIKYLDEEMAREIADLVTGIENSVEDADYEVEIEFDEQSFEWVVRYISKKMQEADGDSESVTVRIRKDNGIITLDDNRSS